VRMRWGYEEERVAAAPTRRLVSCGRRRDDLVAAW
jgi:hypothetical protein